jgi:hypothetical protein
MHVVGERWRIQHLPCSSPLKLTGIQGRKSIKTDRGGLFFSVRCSFPADELRQACVCPLLQEIFLFVAIREVCHFFLQFLSSPTTYGLAGEVRILIPTPFFCQSCNL